MIAGSAGERDGVIWPSLGRTRPIIAGAGPPGRSRLFGFGSGEKPHRLQLLPGYHAAAMRFNNAYPRKIRAVFRFEILGTGETGRMGGGFIVAADSLAHAPRK